MKRLLIDFSDSIVRTALVNDSVLVDLIIDSKENISLVSNIYVGVVKKILPSQFVFVDIGQDKNAFLQLNDNRESHLYDNNNKLKIKMNQEIIVQVLKDPHGTKGACVTSQLSFVGNFMVLFTNAHGTEIGISKKIEDPKKREHLKNIALKIVPKGYGLILRTKSQDKTEEEIFEELLKLITKSKITLERAKYIKGTFPVYKDNFIGAKAIREIFTDDIDEITINEQSEFSNVENIISSLSSKHKDKIKIYDEKLSLFNNFFIETAVEKLLNKKIWLKCGGFLIIEETEACFVIDVNTGKFEGKKNHNDTIFKTNLEACYEICRQIRLRNLSGMIIIDFIDMKEQKYRDELLLIFSEELKKDRISTSVFGMTKLGLVQITRKKTREPISNILLKKCSCCSGTGKVESEVYVADRIYKTIDNIFKNTTFNKLTVKANKDVIIFLKSESSYLKDLQKKFNRTIIFKNLETPRIEYFEIEKETV